MCHVFCLLLQDGQKRLLLLGQFRVLFRASRLDIFLEHIVRVIARHVVIGNHRSRPTLVRWRHRLKQFEAEVNRQFPRPRLLNLRAFVNDCLDRLDGRFHCHRVGIGFDHRHGDVQGPGVGAFETLELGRGKDS